MIKATEMQRYVSRLMMPGVHWAKTEPHAVRVGTKAKMFAHSYLSALGRDCYTMPLSSSSEELDRP